MDNRQFNINGRGKEMLTMAMRLAFIQAAGCYNDELPEYERTVSRWLFNKDAGLILLAYGDVGHPFPSELTADAAAVVAYDWLTTSEEAKSVVPTGWDADADHDGHNELGWRVYVEEWGHVNNIWGVIAAVKPAYLWYGK